MPRPRKANEGQVVVWPGLKEDRNDTRIEGFGVIVGYSDDKRRNRYAVVRSDMDGRRTRGPVKWMDASDFDIVPGRANSKAPRTYRQNERQGGDLGRGCRCQCCAHVRGFEAEPS